MYAISGTNAGHGQAIKVLATAADWRYCMTLVL
jgi:hypothetical protein